MTVPSTVSRSDFVGNGAASVYAYNYRILAETDLVVTVADLVDAETTLVLATDYTVSGVQDASGGNVTLVNGSQAWLDVSGNLLTGFALTIRRVRPVTQGTDIRNQGPYFPNVVEDTFDHLVMLAQQRQDEVNRSLKLPETEAGLAVNTVIPSVANRASMVLAFNAAGEIIAQANVPSGAVAATAYMKTLLDDPDAATARDTLGIVAPPDGILNGTIEEQAAPDATLRTIGLVIAKDGIRTAVTNQNLTITANASGNPRVDMVEWNGNALSVKAGTAAADPDSPSPTAGSIPIALVLVPDSFSTVNSFGSSTNTEAVIIALYNAFGGLYATNWSNAIETITGASVELPNARLPLYFPNPGWGYEITSTILMVNVSAVAKAGLIVSHRFDGADPGQLGSVNLMAKDTGENERVSLVHRETGFSNLVGGITVGPHRLVPLVSREGNNVKITGLSLSVRQIR